MSMILVPVADRPECARALQTAFDLAERIEGSVRGCHMRPHRLSKTTLGTDFANALWRKRSTKRAPAAAKSLFAETAAQHGYSILRRPRAEPCAIWGEMVGSPEKLMGIVGPVSDFVVVSRPTKPGNVADMFLHAALIRSSRPVLILPRAPRKVVGRRICIGWNQSPDAARCVSAALPILEQAESVSIVSCGPEDRVGPKSNRLLDYLTHWGIKATLQSTVGRDTETELLEACKDMRADLLMGGAYSRSRWRERAFGGTTEFLLRKARLPLLLLHG